MIQYSMDATTAKQTVFSDVTTQNYLTWAYISGFAFGWGFTFNYDSTSRLLTYDPNSGQGLTQVQVTVFLFL